MENIYQGLSDFKEWSENSKRFRWLSCAYQSESVDKGGKLGAISNGMGTARICL